MTAVEVAVLLVKLAVPLAVVSAIVFALTKWAETGVRRLAIDYGLFAVFVGFAAIGVWVLLNRNSGFLDGLLRKYWLAALFGVFILEGAMVLYFAPSEALVPAAIVLTLETDVAKTGPEVYVSIIVTAVVGATVGQYLLFLLAKRWGRERLLAKSWFRVSEGVLDRFDRLVERWGPIAVPVSNSLLFTRGMLTVPAGLAEMDDREFIFLSAVGTLIFETALTLLTLGIVEFAV